MCFFLLVLTFGFSVSTSTWPNCVGDFACISQQHNNCSNCDPICNGVDSCKNVTMTCVSGVCELTCLEEESCESMFITVLKDAFLNITCGGKESCRYQNWNIYGSVHFDCTREGSGDCIESTFKLYLNTSDLLVTKCNGNCDDSFYYLYNGSNMVNDNDNSDSLAYIYDDSTCDCSNGMSILSLNPTSVTTNPTINPTVLSDNPSANPSDYPTSIPSINPSMNPSQIPTQMPTIYPTLNPSTNPSIHPTNVPSIQPTVFPSKTPTITPIIQPTNLPSHTPTINPTKSSSGSSQLDTIEILLIIAAPVIGIVAFFVYFTLQYSKKRKHKKTTKNIKKVNLTQISSVSKKESDADEVDGYQTAKITTNNIMTLNDKPIHNQNEFMYDKSNDDDENEDLFVENVQNVTTNVSNTHSNDDKTNMKNEGEKIQLGNVHLWKNKEVLTWLNNVVNLPQYSDIFENNFVDGLSLLSLTDEILLNSFNIIGYGHRYKIIQAINKLKV